MTLSVAVVGAGPSGFYAAQALVDRKLDCRIDLIEALPTPFGLIRGGVAPDHQHTKRIAKTYEKTAEQAQVAFFGNVDAGHDIGIPELRALYDVVILAVGMPLDSALSIPGNDKKGVYGAAEFVGWYNGLPAVRDLDPLLDEKGVAVIGNGNVALDIARLLGKTRAETAITDMPDYALDAIHKSSVTDIHIFGRRGAADAKFTNVELREIGRLADCAPVVDADVLPTEITAEMSDRDKRLRERNIATLREYSDMDPAGKSRRIHFCFHAMPAEILGDDRVCGLRLQRAIIEDGKAVGTGAYYDVSCGTVIAAIGYRMKPLEGVRLEGGQGRVIHTDGRVEDGLYVVGWAKRGPTGVISSNKTDGQIAAEQIEEDFKEGSKPGRPALEESLRAKGVRWVSFEDWRELDEAEIAAAADGAPRRKLVDIDEMISLLDSKGRKAAVHLSASQSETKRA